MNDINEIITTLTKQEKNVLVSIHQSPNGRSSYGNNKLPLHLKSVIEKQLVFRHIRTFKLTNLGKIVAKQLSR